MCVVSIYKSIIGNGRISIIEFEDLIVNMYYWRIWNMKIEVGCGMVYYK